MDDGEETIEDAAILAQVRRQARKVQLQSTLTAAALTTLSLAIPG
jgi:hypothetical protein